MSYGQDQKDKKIIKIPAKLEKIAEALRQAARKAGVSTDEGTYFARLDKKKIDRALRKLDRLRKV